MYNTLETTNRIIKKYDIRAAKKLGQNFLVDDTTLEKITDISDIKADDLVIEIGPGLGNLTQYIFEKTNFVIAVEIDKKMVDILNQRFKDRSDFLLINDDILKLNLDQVIRKYQEKVNVNFKNVKCIANLPYYITTPILFYLLQSTEIICDFTLMVQKEVADRIVALPNSKDYGILTLTIKYLSDVKVVSQVSKDFFIPRPNVDSAIITLKKQKKYFVKNQDIFFELIRKAFAQRRKKLVNSLYSTHFLDMPKDKIEQLLLKCNIDLNTRAEQLGIDKYVQIVNSIDK